MHDDKTCGFAITRRPAQVYVVKIMCECGGELIGGKYSGVRMRVKHVCNACGHVMWRERKHPRIEHVRKSDACS